MPARVIYARRDGKISLRKSLLHITHVSTLFGALRNCFCSRISRMGFPVFHVFKKHLD